MTSAARGFEDVAVTGIGTTDFRGAYLAGRSARTAESYAAEAFAAALDDADLERRQIDGLIGVRVSYERMGPMLGIERVKLASYLEGAGRMAGVAVEHAALAISAGRANHVAIVYGNNGRSSGERYGGTFGFEGPEAYDLGQGMTSPGAYVAMMFRRHQHEFGTGADTLASIAISNRRHAGLNPAAVFQSPITRDDYNSAPYIAEPLRLLDYCMINDGGVCLIVSSRQAASELRHPPVVIQGLVVGTELTTSYTSRDCFYTCCRQLADELHGMTGKGPDDVDCLQAYDNFTPTVLFALEGFGFCGRGESGGFVTENRIGLGGQLPVNTAGGHTSEGYMQGFGHLAEAVRQVRGTAGARQVAGCRLAQYICVAPIASACLLGPGG